VSPRIEKYSTDRGEFLGARDVPEQQHTPGPWTITHPYAWKCEIRSAKRFIGNAGRADETREEMEANARLIAAAPDLLQACEEAQATLALIAHDVQDDERENKIASVVHTQAELREAIRKARGAR
jgi:hypothetical protein